MHSHGDGHIHGLARRHSSPSQGHEASCMVTVEQGDIFATGLRTTSIAQTDSRARVPGVTSCAASNNSPERLRPTDNRCRSQGGYTRRMAMPWIVQTMVMAGKAIGLE